MKTKFILLASILAIASGLKAQTIFRGTVIDATSRNPIALAKLGVSNQGIGVLSRKDGTFAYKKYHETLSDTDTLIVSASGYESIKIDAKELRKLLNRSSTIILDPSTNVAQKKIQHLKVFWDISEGMKDRNLDQELAYVENYLSQMGKISLTLEVFNTVILHKTTWSEWDGDMKRFHKSVTKHPYNGPSNYNLLRLEGADAALLLSNGEPTYGTLAVSQEKPVKLFSTSLKAKGTLYANALAAYTSVETMKGTADRGSKTPTNVQDKEVTKSVNKRLPQIPSQEISGTVTSLATPLQGATIMIQGDLKEYLTEADGSFTIPATQGDIISIRALGMFPKAVAIQNTKPLTIKMLPSSDQLDEVLLTGRREKIYVGNGKIVEGTNEPFIPGGITSLGDFYITNKDITPDGQSLERVLRKYFKGVVISYTPRGEVVTIFGKRPRWVLNGHTVRSGEPIPLYIPDNEILSVIIKDSPLTNLKYGGEGDLRDGSLQVIVTTKNYRKDYEGNTTLVKGNDYTEKLNDISTSYSQITGTVSSPNGPLQGAEIVRKGSLEIAYTQSDGSFNLKAGNGDVLIISGLGMFTKEVTVNDQKVYTIELLPSSDLLDEVVLVTEKTKLEKLYEKKDEINKKIGFASTVILKEEFENKGYTNTIDLISGQVPSTAQSGIYPNRRIINTRSGDLYAVAIDGVLRENSILEEIQPSTIAMINVIRSPAAGNKYGISTSNGLIDIITQPFQDKDKDKDKPSALVTGNDYKEEVQDLSKITTQITGIIRGPEAPIKGATITKKGSFYEVDTDREGRFTITASLNEILILSAPSMFTKEVLIESIDMGTIELTPKSNDLDEIVLEGRERVDNTVETAYGTTSGDKVGYATAEINTRDYSAGYTNLDQLIKEKVSGVQVNSGLLTGQATTYKIRGGSQSATNEKPPIWIVNGTPYQDPPEFLDVNQIENISVLKSVVATSRYGSLAAGGAFLIKTKELNFKDLGAKKQQSALVSGNEYTGGVTGNVTEALPAYIKRFRESGTPQEQFALYKKLARTQESPLEYYVDAAQYFQSLNPALGDEVRSDLAYIARNNRKALRTLAYLYELVNDTKNGVLVNERIVKIAPQEAQSYRDLALAYQDDKQYDKSLELYINMLGEQIMGVNFEGLEKPLCSELSRLVALYKDKIDFERLPNEWLRADFKRDMRMVIDWSDRSVPFEFQFVNPDKKFFKWSHTLEETRERLQAEQKQGFQAEEFIIDDAPAGEWLINVQYLGNEGDYVLPPFLKYTVFRNYGTVKETKEVRVIKLFKQAEKVTLGRVTM